MCPALQSFSVIRNKENEVLILISGIGCPLKGQMGLCGSDKFTNIRIKKEKKNSLNYRSHTTQILSYPSLKTG